MRLYNKELSTFEAGEESVNLIKTALPKLFDYGSIYIVGSVSTAMLSWYSQDAVSAVNVALQVLNLIIILFNIILTGGNFTLSFELGRNNRKRASEIVGTAFCIDVLLAAVLGAVLFFMSHQVAEMMNLQGEVCDMASQYLKMCAAFLPITVLVSFFVTVLICTGHSLQACIISVINNVVNVLLCYVALYSGWGVMPDGVLGVAAARIIAQAAALFAGVCMYAYGRCPFKLCFKPSMFRRIIKIGLPGGMCSVSYNFAQTITTAIIATFGTLIINSKVYYTNILCYVPVISVSIGFAGGILIGRYKAVGDYKSIKELCAQNLRLTILINLSLTILIYIFRKQLLSIFTDDAFIIELAGRIMLIDIFVELGRAMNNVFENAYCACGDVKTTMIVSICSCWLGSVLLTYILGVHLGWGLVGCWIAFAADELFKATIYLLRWKTGRWMRFDL